MALELDFLQQGWRSRFQRLFVEPRRDGRVLVADSLAVAERTADLAQRRLRLLVPLAIDQLDGKGGLAFVSVLGDG